MNKIVCVLLLFFFNSISNAQVGIGTTNPDGSSILDIEATDKGVLVPRLTTAERNAISNPATSLLIFNITTQQFEFNSGTSLSPVWRILNANPNVSSDANNIITSGSDGGSFLESTTYIGKFIISATGSQTIVGLPFQPSSIMFSAHANVESYNVDGDNGFGNNTNTFQNAFGSMQGFATNYGGSILQQAIYIGGNGTSINDISRYASDLRAIGIRYSNQNGDFLGFTAAEVTAFNTNGFTINVTDLTEAIVVIFEAHR
ncbi:hypothetical protein ACKGJY_06270 [Hyunsoonleella sp. 2307UL5-6]|uniref:hypothetical protein n=1 Tax=Hyunsoonleella sp. 2307UL5-6 TaxID=3384768 RepID=UPI0039BD48D0